MRTRPIVGALPIAVLSAAALAQSDGTTLPGVEFRTMDGSGNNLTHTDMGSTGAHQLRLTTPTYSDGLGAMRSGPHARVISNAVGQQTTSGNSANLSAMFWQWGQFIDHDMVLTHGGGEFSPMFAPGGDPVFPAGSMIPFSRSGFETDASGVRQFANGITAFLDGSMVYGSDDARADTLRSFTGGRLALDASGFMLRNTTGIENANDGFLPNETMFLAGDIRANEQAGLTAMHTVFAREHNLWADRLASENPGWNDEQIYQMARKIVGAEIQKITYDEWLPAMLGNGALGVYSGYDSGVDAGISLEFSTAAFRFGHTMLNENLMRLSEDGSEFAGGALTLHQNFFNPDSITGAGALDALMRGMAAQEAEELDTQLSNGVRNLLFGDPGHGGMDLLAANLMRGRDHGIGTFNDIREAFGLERLDEWSQLTTDTELAAALSGVYDSVDALDAWIGLVAEDKDHDAIVGETLSLALADQFARLRDGDRFFYLNDDALAPYMIDIDHVTLDDILSRNTEIGGFDGSVFYAVPAPGAVSVLAMGGVLATRRRRAS